jgi:diguanylate cyclase (GGDEF)-like protein/PAS domain S-box-containing protein
MKRVDNDYLLDLKILVVDDQDDIREALVTLIGLWSHNVYGASNGKEGFELYQTYLPDIVITDIRMPVVGGLEMIEKIKAHNPSLPIIITSAFQDPEYLLNAIELKVDGYIVKPIKKRDLKSRLEHISKALLFEEEIAKRLKAEQEYEDLYDFSAEMHVSVDPKSAKILKCNQTLANKLGYTKDEIIGREIFDLYHPECMDDVQKAFHQFVTTGKVTNAELILQHKNGDKIDVLLNVTSVRDKQGTILYSRSTWVDISEKKHYEAQLNAQNRELMHTKSRLQYQSEHDILTQLPNRLLFLDRLNQGIKHAKRYEKQLAILFMDLDHFKEINDSLGHDVGDELLVTVAKRLQDTIRKSDTIARLGGDEFGLIVDDLESSDYVIQITQKILQLMAQPVVTHGKELYTSFSIGISIYPDDGEDAESLLKNADAAMYRVKDEGRNNYQFYTADMTARAFERMMLESQLRKAIQNGELELYYQAQIDVKKNKIIGMEALVRWQHPQLGLVLPSKFIPLAEETGLIVQIDDWVMQEAIEQWMVWLSQDIDAGRLSLNLSRLRLNSPQFIANIKHLLDSYTIDPKRIILEVTESQIMKNPHEAIKTLNELHALGIDLAIDDFGTGYSSLAYLKQLPINKLKIDQSFIHDIPNDMDDMEITRTIIAMSKGLNLEIIAEGVETSKQVEFLIENGCSEVQGFLYHKPAPKEEVEHFILHYNTPNPKEN